MTKNRNRARKTKRIVRAPATKFAQLRKRLEATRWKKGAAPSKP